MKFPHTHLIYLFLSLFFIAESKSQNRKTSDFIDNYLDAAFDVVNGRVQPLLKWGDIDTLKYRIMGEKGYMNEKGRQRYFTKLEGLIGKTFVPTQGDDYHILAYFGPMRDYLEFTNNDVPIEVTINVSSWRNRTINPDGNLKRSSFCIVPDKIPTSSIGTFLEKKLFLVSLGMMGEIRNDGSIFSQTYSSSYNSLTRADKRLVKLHYHDRLQSGARRSDVYKILLDIDNIDLLAVEKL